MPRPSSDDLVAAAALRGGRAVLADLDRVRLGELSAAGRVDALVAFDKLGRWVEGQKARILAAMWAGQQGPAKDKEWAREDVATALRVSPTYQARVVVTRRPALTTAPRATSTTAGRPTREWGSPRRRRRSRRGRADALVELVTGAASADRATVGSGVQVTVALSTLLHLDAQPADLDRFGPVAADVARLLASSDTARWRLLLTDQHGRLLDCGRTTYRPTAALRRYIEARDRTCRFPAAMALPHRPLLPSPPATYPVDRTGTDSDADPPPF